MHLREVHLRNWRSYRNAIFSLPAPDRAGRRNVILIGAQNGVGKTSFLMALYLGLFGREAVHLIEGMRLQGADQDKAMGYRALMEQIVHRPAIASEDLHCSVGLKFDLSDGEVSITRRWNYMRGGKVRDLNSADGEEVLIEANGRRKVYAVWQEANARIEELLFPCNVMPCLFFDGEQAQERVEAAGGHALFDAVKTLYGTGIIDELSDSLKSYVQNERSSLQREVGSVRSDELAQKRAGLDLKRDELKVVLAELGERRKEKLGVEFDQQKLNNQLFSMVGDSASDLEQYGGILAALQEEELQYRQELVSGLSSLALPLALSRHGSTVASMIRSEQIRDRWLILKDEASGKAETIIEGVLPSGGESNIQPPLLPDQASQLRSRLANALEALWTPPPDGCADDYGFSFLGATDRAAVLSKLERLSISGRTNVADSAMKLATVLTKIRETRRGFDKIKDIQPQLESIKKELGEILSKLRDCNNACLALEHRERGLNSEINDLRGAIGQMERRESAHKPVQEKIEVAERVRTLIDEAKEQLIPLCKEALEERCTLHFRKMISDEYSNFDARFGVDADPWLEGPDGRRVLVSSLSGAQKRAFGLAFTLAVADVSGQEAPIVVDTPVGNMDSQYRERVLRYVADAAPGQVLFLSHDEEIYGAYHDKLSSKIRKSFLVTFEKAEEGSGVSTVNDDRYF
jgi:DNA sulfur modification protein DndD